MTTSTGLPFLWSRFRNCRGFRRTRSIVPAQMSAMFHPVDVNPGACREPTPRIPDPLHHPGPTKWYCCPEISPFRRYNGGDETTESAKNENSTACAVKHDARFQVQEREQLQRFCVAVPLSPCNYIRFLGRKLVRAIERAMEKLVKTLESFI